MLRGGGLCLAGPGDPSLNKVSPRIRALQDRLMDSLPSEGAWECLSPAQREAILSIHRSRTASTDDSSEHGEGGRHSGLRKPARLHAVPRFARSRSYDDRLESETDDSGVRGVNGTSSGANSHNSLEDDSSDTGFKRGPGRFAKVAAVDRAAKRDGKNDMHDMNNGKNIRKADIVTNGFGNVNKIISKQMNKCSGMVSGPSNITLDCRNVHGEKRRRSRIDVDDPFRECSVESSLEAIHEHEPSRRNGASDSQQTRLGLGKKNGLTENFESETKLHSLKETASSEEYDSGVNFKNDDSMDEYVRDRQNGGCEFNSNLESDRTPRSDTSTSSTTPHKRDRSLERLRSKGEDPTPRKLSGERNLPCWDRSLDKLDKSRSQEREGRSGLTHSLDKQVSPDRPKSAKSIGEPLKSNLKVGYGAKLNSSFDYRTNLNQDQLNKYSSNWNNIILSKDIPIKSSSAIAVPQAVANGRESRFAKNPSGVVASRSAGHLANKTAVAAQKKADPVNWAVVGDSRKISSSSQDRGASKKYLRSKSLDRKYLEDDSSDEDSDFETRRRTDRVRRYQRASQDWEMGRLRGGDDRGRQRGKDMTDFKPLKRNPPVSGQPIKARSVWDLSGYLKKTHDDEFDDFDDVGFRTRSDFRNRWQSEGDDVTCLRKLSDNTEFNHKQWNRRSCDFELEFQNEDSDRRSWDKADIDRKRWYRRSCDLDLDFEFHNRQRREVEFDTAWGQETLEDCDEYDPELVEAKGKRSRACVEDFMVCDSRRGQDDKGRRTRLDDVNDLRLHLEDDQERRTRLEDHYRSKTSMGSHARDKRERSRTPHLLRENGVLSFENPNYTLGGANDPRLDDALNSNNGPATHDGPLDGGLAALDSLYTELDHVCNLTRSSSIRTRRHYAHLDIGSMGVDVATGPVTNLDQADHQNNSLLDNESIMGRKQGLSYSITTQPDLIEHVAHRTNLQQHSNNQIVSNNQDDTENDDKRMLTPEGGEGGVDSGIVTDGGSTSSSNSSHQGRQSPAHIPHMTAGHTQDLYALPVKRPPTQTGSQHSTPTHQPTQNDSEEKTDPPIEDTLPPGWEKHEDNDGPYYWHIKSGTITRTPPEPTDTLTSAPLRAERRNKDTEQTSSSVGGSVTRSNTSSALSELSDSRPRTAAVDNAYKRRSYPARSDITEGSGGRPIRFAVRSLGWVEIAEEDLTPERSSKAVNRCIVDLSVGRRDVLDVVGCWGDGKDLFMDLDEGSLKLVDPENLTVLNTQPIHTIRVWGVGRDNGRERDFAYVARDRVSRKHMCHVFRCDTPARTIANTLRDICKKIMIERSLQQNMNKPLDTNSSGGGTGRLTRPTNLPTEHRRLHRHSQIITTQSFPTPMEEPKKVMRVQYVGFLQVESPSGMDVLNTAIDRVIELNPKPWKNVSVAVAPSTVTITNTDDGKQIAECRVRFLSFLGIGQDVKHCAFIMHTAQDQFIAHVFHCEPSTGALCKTIEAACKLRYQKCLDAHPGVSRGRGAGTPRSISATLRSVFGSITGRKARSAES